MPCRTWELKRVHQSVFCGVNTWLSSIISSKFPTPIGVPRRSSTWKVASQMTMRTPTSASLQQSWTQPHLGPLLLRFLFLGLKTLLVLDELLLHEQIIFDPFKLQQA
eukprot:1554047-Rhodomonas_salina.3